METKIDALYATISELPTRGDLKELINNIFLEREAKIIQCFRDELRTRDDKIAELEQSLRGVTESALPLSPSSHSTPTLQYSDSIDIVDKNILDGYAICGTSQTVPLQPSLDKRQHINTLFIGSSMIRYVELDATTYGKVMKVCVPGATAGHIWSRLVEYDAAYTFDRVVIHVGTNYMPRQPGMRWFDWRRGNRTKEYARCEMLDFLKAATLLMPKSCIIFSSMLPRGFKAFSPEIITFNRWMQEACFDLGLHFIHHDDFWKRFDNGAILICWDNIHLNRRGVDIMQRSLNSYFA